jgi:hypothetical protein
MTTNDDRQPPAARLVRPALVVLVMALLAGVALAACRRAADGPGSAQPTTKTGHVAPVAGHDHPMAGLNLLPPDMRQLPAPTEEAFLFSVANPEVAQAIPCYCGCVGLGHVSSYDCYVAEVEPNGALVFDAHALNCQVCVDITQDTMRLLDEGRAPPEIRAYIDENYAAFGPPTPLDMADHSS